MSYFDVQEFLADANKLPCKIKFDIPDAGHLEGTNEKHLREGTSLELPYWLVGTLYAKEMIDITLPRSYTTRVRNALAASADSVNLRNLGGGGGAFYSVGNKLEAMVEDASLATTLQTAFVQRLSQIQDQSQHSSADTGGEAAAYEFCQSLDLWERELFLLGEQSAKDMKAWQEVKIKKPR